MILFKILHFSKNLCMLPDEPMPIKGKVCSVHKSRNPNGFRHGVIPGEVQRCRFWLSGPRRIGCGIPSVTSDSVSGRHC